MGNLNRFLLLILACLVMQQSAWAAIPEAAANALRNRVASAGELRVIVQIAAIDQTLGDMLPAARQSRMQLIAGLQSGFFAQVRQPGLQEISRFETIPFVVLSADLAAIDLLANLPQVLSIQEDIPEAPTLASSLPVIGAANAWAAGYDGTGQVVAVLDTGVSNSHPFFPPGKVAAQACFSSNGDSVSFCSGQASSSTAPGSGTNCPVTISGCDHGTHVAGIAVGNPASGSNKGVAGDARLIPIQVFSCFGSVQRCKDGTSPGFANALAYPSDQIRGLEHVLTLSASISIAAVNVSIGSSMTFSNQASCDAENGARKAAIDNLRAAGIATIIAAGNSSNKVGLSQPGCISSAISVGNTTDADEIAATSNVAAFLKLLAPGSDITSSVPGGSVASKSGTSMAAPHVAGAWAILREAKPDATIDQVLTVLRDSATSIDDQRDGGSIIDMRRINLGHAVTVFTQPQPKITTNPLGGSSIDLGDVTPGASGAVMNISVSNTGNADLTLSCDVTGAQASMFVMLQCPSPIAASTSSDISLRCDPQNGGELTATLAVSSNDLTESQLYFSLSCTGLGPEIASLPVSGTELDFAGVQVDTHSSLQHIQITNSGNQALNLLCNLSGADLGSFAVTACPTNIAAGGQALVSLRCQPGEAGASSASLAITSNDFDESPLSFALACVGLAPEFYSNPPPGSLLDFAVVIVSKSSEPLEVTISNTGGAALNMSCTLQGLNSTAFQLVQCPSSIEAMQSALVQLRCSPVSVGDKLAQLRINSDDGDEPEALFELSCQSQASPGTVFRDGFEVD